MSVEIFKKLFNKSYDAVEACKRQNLNEDMIEKLRVRLQSTQFVPKVIINSQVCL